MRYRQSWLRAAAAVVVLTVGWASPAWAQSCAVCKTTSLFLPLSGVFFYPPTPIIPQGENVSLTGKVHVVTHVVDVVGGNFLTDVYLNMAGVIGVGQTTRKMYIGTGSNKFLGVAIPTEPVIPPNPIRASFILEPTNRGGSVPLLLKFLLVLGTDGTLLPSSTVTVDQVY
jgi:hypothetical protein